MGDPMDAESTSFGRLPEATGGDRVVRDVVRDVVAEVAPEELVIVEGLTRFDDGTVVRRLAGSGRRRDPLGFGVAEIAALVTPVVWLVLDEAAKRAVDSAVDGAAKGAKALLHKVLRRRSAPVTVPVLTREQLGEVRRRVLETAAQRGLGQDRATAIADAVIARLALAEGGDDTESSAASDRPADGGGPAGG